MHKKIILSIFFYPLSTHSIGINVIKLIEETTQQTHNYIHGLDGLARLVNDNIGSHIRLLNTAVISAKKEIVSTNDMIQELHKYNLKQDERLECIDSKIDLVNNYRTLHSECITLIHRILNACIERESYTSYLEEMKTLVEKLQADKKIKDALLEKIFLFFKVLKLKEKEQSQEFKEWIKVLTSHEVL